MAIAKDVSKEGQNAHTVTGWKCDHFKVKVRKKGASLLIFNLSGDMGLCDAGNGLTGIEVCLRVPPNVADRAKIEMVT